MRVIVAEDSALFREGIVRLLEDAGHHVVAAVGDARALIDAVRAHRPDIAVIDVRMPPTMTDDGVQAAQLLRRERPDFPMLLLSQHIETAHSVPLVSTGAFGYLLKDRVLRVDDFLAALIRVADGGSALDPEVVAALIQAQDTLITRLSERERDVLALVAEGHSNTAIATRLVIAERTVEAHMRSIFQKLHIQDSTEHHRRILAVLAYLKSL
ncbi:response regulator transcription factor [Nonomuraea fuscirosea]|uniref:response regulator transcription factor n=1 Tax=Nonomuraea fuscirosea TaxID=1291556 RepID=UPI002DDC7457|nr:response regulator transcription factor [Nonomuraea fuscirosea]WSA56913.1 response regulator transcription factor [Nonomuraea fuscirosea]